MTTWSGAPPHEPAKWQPDQNRPEASDPARPAHHPGEPPDADEPYGDWDLAPGREQAVGRGCRCPTLANTAEFMRRRGMLIAPDCPLHRPLDA